MQLRLSRTRPLILDCLGNTLIGYPHFMSPEMNGEQFQPSAAVAAYLNSLVGVRGAGLPRRIQCPSRAFADLRG